MERCPLSERIMTVYILTISCPVALINYKGTGGLGVSVIVTAA